jgi:hypothetical protein
MDAGQERVEFIEIKSEFFLPVYKCTLYWKIGIYLK